jgi:hypothetical protein
MCVSMRLVLRRRIGFAMDCAGGARAVRLQITMDSSFRWNDGEGDAVVGFGVALEVACGESWIPACAGMTMGGVAGIASRLRCNSDARGPSG